MNPACLVQKGREMRSMIRKEHRRQIRESMQTMQLQQPPNHQAFHMTNVNPLEMQLSDLGIADVTSYGGMSREYRRSSVG